MTESIEQQIKKEALELNLLLESYLKKFKLKYNLHLSGIKILPKEENVNFNLIGIGADEFSSLKRVKQNVGIQFLQVSNKVAVKFTQKIPYELFEKSVLSYLRMCEAVKVICRLRKVKSYEESY